jgi:hypothetical protein
MACELRDGQIYREGIWQSRERAVRLAERFEGVSDWFRPDAVRLAQELRAVIAAYDHHHEREAA